MKALIALSVLQLVIMAFLIGKVIAIENRVDPVEYVEQVKSPAIDTNFSQANVDTNGLTSHGSMDGKYDDSFELQMRNIVREELAAQLANLPRPAYQARASVNHSPIDPLQSQHYLDQVMQKLSVYENVGNISNKDMENITLEMARLNQTDRRKAYSKLASAINSGSMKVH